jgi:putative component of toxin-antitoxin plasmid stabilization module
MKFELVKLGHLSGNEASLYAVWFEKLNLTSFDTFLKENNSVFKSELIDIVKRLRAIGSKTGAREKYFKMNEGNPGDGVCALFDSPGKKLRLYCIRYGTLIVVVCGGGEKVVKKLQQDKKLTDENYFLRELSAEITNKIKNDEMWFSEDKMDFEGNLIFNNDDNE